MGRRIELVADFFVMCWSWFKKKRDALLHLTENEKRLQQFCVFSSLSNNQIKTLNNVTFERNFKSNEIIYKIGQPNIVIYFVLEGQVDLYDSDNTDHPDITITKGGMIGSIEIFTGSSRVSTAVAKSNCKMIAISKYDFRNLVLNNPRIGAKILYAFSEKYSSTLYSYIVKDRENAEEK